MVTGERGTVNGERNFSTFNLQLSTFNLQFILHLVDGRGMEGRVLENE